MNVSKMRVIVSFFSFDHLIVSHRDKEIKLSVMIGPLSALIIIGQVDGDHFLDGMVLDIFPIWGDNPFWIEVLYC